MPGPDAPQDLYRRIGDQIRRTRLQRVPQLSQDALARKIGLSRTSMANIEKGRHRVQIHVLYDLARELGVEPTGLLPSVTPEGLPPGFTDQLSADEAKAVEKLLEGKEHKHA